MILPLLVDSFTCSLVFVFVLVVWNQTNAVVEYGRLFGLKFCEYKTQEEVGIKFVDFLEMRYGGNFLIKLICCPICLTTWLCLAAAVYYENYLVFFVSFYVTLMMYFSFKKMMSMSDE